MQSLARARTRNLPQTWLRRRPEGSVPLGKPAADQCSQRFNHLVRLPARCFHRDGGAGPGSEHHEPHDRGPADDFLPPPHPYTGLEFLHRLHEFGRRARVQSSLVADLEHAGDRVAATGLNLGRRSVEPCTFAHLPVRTRLAMVMYLRPESWAAATASGSAHSPRTFASLTNMGKLMPARTSTFGRAITDIARFEGVPPNMSVRIATPSPLSTRLTASMMSLRRCSTSSSGPMVTASICDCGPTTCSSAERNSMASRPWVTRTTPIIAVAPDRCRLHRTKGRS